MSHWFARSFNAGSRNLGRVAAPEPLLPDAAAPPACCQPGHFSVVDTEKFGPDLVREGYGLRHILPFAGVSSMRMRGLEPVSGGLAPPISTQRERAPLGKRPRKSGPFCSSGPARVSNTEHAVTPICNPDLVQIWSETTSETFESRSRSLRHAARRRR